MKNLLKYLLTLGLTISSIGGADVPVGEEEPGLGHLKLTGVVVFQNCQPQRADVRVWLDNKSVTPLTQVVGADGHVRMAYSIPVGEPQTGSFTVRPTLRQGACTGDGVWEPVNRKLGRIPATGVNFAYRVSPGNTVRVRAASVAQAVDQYLGSLKMRLNNHQTQSSSIQIGGLSLNFNVPRTTVDIDCGTFCPDLGDGHFYLNDINLSSADFSWASGAFLLSLAFEDAGREIKGYHSVLGDNGMPDFDMSGIRLGVKASPTLVSGQLSLGFYGARLDADTTATGGCSIGGIDVCNKIFGTDRKIQKGVEKAAFDTLNGSLVQTALRAGIRQYLQSVGVERQIVGVRIEGSDLVISTL